MLTKSEPLNVMFCVSSKLKKFYSDHSISTKPIGAFRTHFELPHIFAILDERQIHVELKIVFSDETTFSSVRDALNEMIAFFNISNLPNEMAPFVRKDGCQYVSIESIEKDYEIAKSLLDDNYCECDGFTVEHIHHLVYELPNEEAFKQLLSNFPECI